MLGVARVDTPEQAKMWVDKYHDANFQQIKIYSSVKLPELKIIADEAHRLGMTTTGHIPEGLNAYQAVEAGQDQINHVEYIADIMHPELPETATRRQRAEASAHIDVNSPEAQKAIAFLVQHHTVVDPTLAIFEMETANQSHRPETFEPGVLRVAPELSEQLLDVGPAPPPDINALINGVVASDIAIVGALHKAGVPIVAGTDQTVPGFSLYREIELYVQAGFTPMEALQAATIVPARVMKLDKELGTVEAGKRADLIIVGANPLDDIHNIRKVQTVVTGGVMYGCAELWKSVGFKPEVAAKRGTPTSAAEPPDLTASVEFGAAERFDFWAAHPFLRLRRAVRGRKLRTLKTSQPFRSEQGQPWKTGAAGNFSFRRWRERLRREAADFLARRAFSAKAVAKRAACGGGHPLIISSANGFEHLDGGMAILKSGGDTLDAALAVVTKVEDDPNDDSVGYGGLPNEDGVVELDASVMHGPTGRCGAVAGVHDIKNVSLLAKAVMQKTNHVFIVGEGAKKFAVDEGFEPMNLLTERSRIAWLAWKASSSPNWRPGIDSPEWKEKLAILLDTPEKQAWRAHIEQVVQYPITGTINCLAVSEREKFPARRRLRDFRGRSRGAWAIRR